jgi:predicted glycosyltransferase involved in capsule biosynthesis
MQLWDSMCWPHVNPVPSGAVGKDCERRLLSRPRFVIAVAPRIITTFAVLNKYEQNRVSTNDVSDYINLFGRSNIHTEMKQSPLRMRAKAKEILLSYSLKWSAFNFCVAITFLPIKLCNRVRHLQISCILSYSISLYFNLCCGQYVGQNYWQQCT